MLIHSGEECSSPAAGQMHGKRGSESISKDPQKLNFPVINSEALRDARLRHKKVFGRRSGADLHTGSPVSIYCFSISIYYEVRAWI